VAPCSVENLGTNFNHKSWHRVQLKIVAQSSIINRGTVFSWNLGTIFNHKSWHRVQLKLWHHVKSQILALCSITNHDTILNHRSWHYVRSQFMLPCSVKNRGTMFNHKSCKYVQSQITTPCWTTSHGNVFSTCVMSLNNCPFFSMHFARFTERCSQYLDSRNTDGCGRGKSGHCPLVLMPLCTP
jgi:hypothetical protein